MAVPWPGLAPRSLDDYKVDADSSKATAPYRNTARALTLQPAAAAVASAVGELVATVPFYPLELMKGRLQAASAPGSDNSFQYNGLVHGLSTVLRDEGFLGLFAGLRATVVRSLATDMATAYFGELFLEMYRGAGHVSNTIVTVSLRVLGGWLSVLLTLPLEAITTRVTCIWPPMSVSSAIAVLWREGGLSAFWRGLGVSFALCVNPALTLTIVDILRSLVLRVTLHSSHRGVGDSETTRMSPLQAFIVGAMAKLMTMLMVYPLIRGKVLLQARDEGGAGLVHVLRQVALREGLQGLYRGLGAQLSKSLVSASAKYAVMESVEQPIKACLHPLLPAQVQHDGNEASAREG